MLIVQMNADRTRFIVGCMTGTSLDGLDAALVEIRGEGLGITARFIAMRSVPLGELREGLRRLASGIPTAAQEYPRAARRLGELHAQVIARLCGEAMPAGAALDFVVAHGQTIWHAPEQHLSWQLLDPWPIVRQLAVPVCCDLRQADLMAGGQGAPITPLSDWVMYRPPVSQAPRLVVNLGGVCNVTQLPAGGEAKDVRGYDVGPCNLLLDGLVRRLLPGRTFDEDGAMAATGTINDVMRVRLHAAPFYRRPQPRTTGREDFSDAWFDQLLAGLPCHRPVDVLASAVDAIAADIADCAKAMGKDAQIVLAGGGAHNHALVARIGHHSGVVPRLSDDLGIPIAAREAMGFAVLGALSQDGIPITLEQVTGARQPGRAGAWIYP